MIFAVASKRAIRTNVAVVKIFQAASGRGFHVGSIEIDQVGITGAMGIVTGRAGRLVIDDMLSVSFETLVAENAGAVVAFVTEGIFDWAFGTEINHGQIALKQRAMRRSMRTVWAGAARSR